MDAFLVNHDTAIRSGAFFGTLILVALWEAALPRRAPTGSTARRWLGNFSLSLLDAVLLRWLVPVAALGALAVAGGRDAGFLATLAPSSWLALGGWLGALDVVAYGKHRALHAVPLLWRVHRVHHADPDADFTTGLRFHPIEGVLEGAVNLVLLMVGVPALAVASYAVVVTATNTYTHGNIRLPGRADPLLRLLLVTPDMHRVHHSARQPETDRNFSVVLSVWDRLFRTYLAQPALGHAAMRVGLVEFRAAAHQTPWGLLALPFLSARPRG